MLQLFHISQSRLIVQTKISKVNNKVNEAIENKERNLLNQNMIKNTILKLVPIDWNCQEKPVGIFTCVPPKIKYSTFFIKYSAINYPDTNQISKYSITVTNSVASSKKDVSAYHGTYQVRIGVDTPQNILESKIKALIGQSGMETTETNLIDDLSKYGFMAMSEVVLNSQINDFVGELIDRPNLVRSNWAVYSEGVCVGAPDINCGIIIYPINGGTAGMELTIGTQLIKSQFPIFNFMENFKVYRELLAKEFGSVLETEKNGQGGTLNEIQFQNTISEKMQLFCNNCSEKPLTQLADFENRIFDVVFEIPSKVETEVDGINNIVDRNISTKMYAIYTNLKSLSFVFMWLNNDRLQTETILPLDNKGFGTMFENEGRTFVDLSKSDPEKEKGEILISLQSLKNEFDKLKDQCKDGNINEQEIAKGFFTFSCNGIDVLRISESISYKEPAVKVDFLMIAEVEEGKAQKSSIIFTKINTFDQFEKMKAEFEKYLGSFKE